MPPPEFFTGDLHNWVNASGKMIQIYDPSTTTLVNGAYQRTPFPNNQIPQSAFDPVAKSIAAYVQPLGKAECSGSGPRHLGVRPQQRHFLRHCPVSATTSTASRRDQVITAKQKIAFLFSRTREQDLGCGNSALRTLPFPLSGNPGYNRSDVYRLSYDYTHLADLAEPLLCGRKQLAAESRIVYHLFKARRSPSGIPTQSTGWKSKGICIPNWPDCKLNFSHGEFFDNFHTWGVGAPNGSDNIVVEFRDDMTKVHGSHTFKWGYYYNNTHYNGFGLTNIAGNDDLLLSQHRHSAGHQPGKPEAHFASFLLGQASGYQPGYRALHRRPVPYPPDVYSGRLARVVAPDLNLGLRYEINLAPIYGDDILSNFNPTTPNPGAGGRLGALVFAGNGPGRTEYPYPGARTGMAAGDRGSASPMP